LSVKKRIALITTWFPPQQSVATNRMLAFVEYLSVDFEIEVFCLSQKNETIDWKHNVKVHYSSSSNLFERLKDFQSDGPLLHKFKVGTRILLSKFIKSPLKKWQLASTKKLFKRHSENSFDVIISSYSPQEAHLVSIEFCKKHPTIPWIADMRDEMSTNPYLKKTAKLNFEKTESEVNKYASALLSVSEPIIADFKRICPSIPHFLEVRNGFNHDYRRILVETVKNEKFTLGYFGTFYGSRKPTIILEALKQLIQEVPGFDFEWFIIGAHQNFTIPIELAHKIVLLPPLKYLEAIHKMAEMDLNIQLHPRSEQKGIFTGKLFDYISVQKPVLALVDSEDVAAQLINEFNCGYVAEFSELEENKNMLLAAFTDWENHKLKFATNEQVESLHRNKQVEKLMKLINELI
jgi:glycosyltransferase involved in cell wall biosynthesis